VFKKILIANRGEIACRVIRTARAMGIKTVAVYSDADARAPHVKMADESVRLGPPPASESYLKAELIIDACKATGAEAVHPGYGFLSERSTFAKALEKAGITFIGPPPKAIAAMGDKIESKKLAQKAGVNVVPGYLGDIATTNEAVKIAKDIGFPVMMKASAGGGGKGMRLAWDEKDVREGFESVKREGLNSFGDDRVFIEKFIEQPRHIEIQVLGDKHGQVIHLNERECSIQRRNQKVIEEAPSPFLDEATRQAMGAQAVALAKAVDYDSAGTVEFIVDAEKNFYFLEMNTRLQVEHPVTELITGVDLVEQMIRVAAGETLSLTQADAAPKGWAVESRIYAEDPYRNFLPSIGRLVRYQPPTEGAREDGRLIVRNDSGVREGDEISMFYDPMIAKLCVWGEARAAAVDGMAQALESFHIEGVGQNLPFLSAVMDQERFRQGRLTTGYIAEEFPGGFRGLPPTSRQSDILTAAAVFMHQHLTDRAWKGAGARNQGPDAWVVLIGRQSRSVRVSASPTGLSIELADENRTLDLRSVDWTPGQALFRAVLDGEAFAATVRRAADGFVVRHRAAEARVRVLGPKVAELYARLPERAPADTSRLVLSPMPGLMVAVEVKPGQEVKSGETVAIIEAMKMQNIIKAERDGVVKSVNVKPGESVAADEVLVELT
jgi:propionyl-CoA carboxylase alpha chain